MSHGQLLLGLAGAKSSSYLTPDFDAKTAGTTLTPPPPASVCLPNTGKWMLSIINATSGVMRTCIIRVGILK